MRKNFCLYPFNAFSIDNAGKQRICCNNDAWDRVRQNVSISDEEFDVEKSFNNPLHKELRQYFIEDKRHESCKKCWEVEDKGFDSYRTWYNTSFDDKNIDSQYWIDKCDKDGTINDIEYMYLDITFGNKCNLKCVMCNGMNSSLFAKEQFDNEMITQVEYDRLLKLDWYKDGEVIKKIFGHLSNVQRIHILGGEPLIIDHLDFLHEFVKNNTSKNITLSYNTNLTTLPSVICSTWKHFKRVYLCISVDAYGENNEFIRYPMKWKKLEKNISMLADVVSNNDNISCQIHSTFGSYNVFEICELMEWMGDINKKYQFIEPHPMTNYVYSPKYFDPKNLPLPIKQKAFEQFSQWIQRNKEYAELSSISYNAGPARIGMIQSYFMKMVEEECDQEQYKKGLKKLSLYENIRGKNFPGLHKLLDSNEIK